MKKGCFEIHFTNNGYTEDWNKVMRYMILQNADFTILGASNDALLIGCNTDIARELIEQLESANCLFVVEVTLEEVSA